ncbi:hypothetical protein J3R30DRAFT_845356 [Lentinula aciculospora]|uniref:Uncharacterized protein n=1 Tax=Lentinula aciculospora TaxID=153920 RepID=A0A9W9DW51_9AGAR|nr:hypothetical protein J3R30DRAFT_845356 [Lentinula aciculospora]
MDQPRNTNHSVVLVSIIISAVIFLVILSSGTLYYFRRRWTRKNHSSRQSYITSPVAPPSILSFAAGHSTDGEHSNYRAVPNPHTYYIPQPSLVRSTSPDQLTVSTSIFSLPKSLNLAVQTHIHQQHLHQKCMRICPMRWPKKRLLISKSHCFLSHYEEQRIRKGLEILKVTLVS